MLQTSTPLITRHDYEEMPEGPPYFQVIEGDLIMSPSPNTSHQDIAGRIYRLIGNFLEKHPLGETYMAPLDVFLGDVNVYQPDVLFVSNRHRSIITERGIEGAPDLVVETLSPATARYDKGFKRKIYARFGVQEYWLVDPKTLTVQIYLLGKNADTPLATHGDKATFTSSVLPGLRIKTAAIFKSRLRK
jgi:Uma2 family endonuclease